MLGSELLKTVLSLLPIIRYWLHPSTLVPGRKPGNEPTLPGVEPTALPETARSDGTIHRNSPFRWGDPQKQPVQMERSTETARSDGTIHRNSPFRWGDPQKQPVQMERSTETARSDGAIHRNSPFRWNDPQKQPVQMGRSTETARSAEIARSDGTIHVW